MSLRRAGVTGLSFEGRDERIARGFYVPVLKESVAYDRATGYFSVESLVHAARGVASLIENGGKMRLILGAHDVARAPQGALGGLPNGITLRQRYRRESGAPNR